MTNPRPALPSGHPDWQRQWPAPAKLNLFLHVVGRRPDGYHLLQTVFRLIDRADQLHFAPRDDGQIVLATPIPGVAPETDLCVRAARLLQSHTGSTCGVTITLAKHLPMGGGLGGGSSDAATVLVALNHLWQTGLSRGELQTLGLQLGADVPVFVFGHNAFAEGVGEALRRVDLPAACYLVIEPGVQVPTATIFGAPDLKRDTPPLSLADWQPGQGHNDLEAVACRAFPAVAEALAALRSIAPEALMTGSGACLFAAFANRDSAESALAKLMSSPWGRATQRQAWLADGLPRHPLAALATSAT